MVLLLLTMSTDEQHNAPYIPKLTQKVAYGTALTSEQQALVDFLVLANGNQFIGFEPSTFSFYLREFRALNGRDRSTSILIKGTSIGTDKLFAAAGYIAPLQKGEHLQ